MRDNDTERRETAHSWLRIALVVTLVLMTAVAPVAAQTDTATATPGDGTAPCAVGPPIYGEQAQDETDAGPLEVAMVSDRSPSMTPPAADENRLEILKNASTDFVERLDAEDEAAAVSWSDTATLDQELTANHQAVIDAINNLNEGSGGQNLDGGINTATTELTTGTNASEDATKVMVVATDAAANNFDDGTALQAAEDAKAEGITVVAIAIGQDADQESIQQLASGDLYYNASDPNALDQIFTDITGDVEAIGSDLIVETRDLYKPGATHDYTIYERVTYDNNTTVRNNVTGQASVTSSNSSVLSVDESSHTLSAVDDANTSTWVRVDATAAGQTGCTNVIVSEANVSALPLLPGIWRFTAVLGDATLFALLLSTFCAVAMTRFTSAFGGLAVGQLGMTIGWLAGYVSWAIAAASLFVVLFIGLNLAERTSFAGGNLRNLR
jgi:uncharacterized protein YegL